MPQQCHRCIQYPSATFIVYPCVCICALCACVSEGLKKYGEESGTFQRKSLADQAIICTSLNGFSFTNSSLYVTRIHIGGQVASSPTEDLSLTRACTTITASLLFGSGLSHSGLPCFPSTNVTLDGWQPPLIGWYPICVVLPVPPQPFIGADGAGYGQCECAMPPASSSGISRSVIATPPTL